MAGTLLLLFISLSITTSLFNNALADNSLPPDPPRTDTPTVHLSQDSHEDNCPALECPVSGKAPFLIVFGDSFFDVGFGMEKLCLPSKFRPYGQKLDKFGRFSDGRTIPDFIAEYLFGDKAILVNQYSCNLVKAEIQSTVKEQTLSFARAGAGVLEGIGNKKDEKTGRTLEEQVELFFELSEMKNLFGEDLTKKEETLYLISIGAFDYLQGIRGKTLTSIDPAKVVEKIVDAVKKITDNGGRRFAFMNIGPLRHYPIVRKLYLDDQELQHLDSLVKEHNSNLTAKLGKTLKGSQYSYSILNYHHIIEKITNKPGSYGFDSDTIKSACCGWGPFKAEGCGSLDTEGCQKDSIEEYVFFDGMHHTEHINHLLARMFWNSNEMASPNNLKSMAGLEKRKFEFPSF